MVQGLVRTGAPEAFWTAAMGDELVTTSIWSVARLSAAMLFLSNAISNVPLIILMRPIVGKLAESDPEAALAAWLIISWTCTTAGNFVITGSAANLIVAEGAQKENKPFLASRHAVPPGTPNQHTSLGVLHELVC